MMMKTNPRVQRKEEESQPMLVDWCWNLKKVCVVFSLGTDHYFFLTLGEGVGNFQGDKMFPHLKMCMTFFGLQ